MIPSGDVVLDGTEFTHQSPTSQFMSSVNVEECAEISGLLFKYNFIDCVLNLPNLQLLVVEDGRCEKFDFVLESMKILKLLRCSLTEISLAGCPILQYLNVSGN